MGGASQWGGGEPALELKREAEHGRNDDQSEHGGHQPSAEHHKPDTQRHQQQQQRRRGKINMKARHKPAGVRGGRRKSDNAIANVIRRKWQMMNDK